MGLSGKHLNSHCYYRIMSIAERNVDKALKFKFPL